MLPYSHLKPLTQEKLHKKKPIPVDNNNSIKCGFLNCNLAQQL